MFTGLLANCTVNDQKLAQVWIEPERAGYSTIVIHESARDALADRLTSVGIDHAGPEPGGGQPILRIIDPDGNRIVCAGE